MAKCSRALLLSFFLVVTALLSGCGIGVVSAPTAVHGAALKGVVHGGQNPVNGAQVYLLAANPAGYGTQSVSELNASSNTTADGNNRYYVTTDAGGNFSITGDYSCTTGTQVYLYAVGGNPGSGTNSAVGLMAALGDCGSLPNISSVIINEVTTVAAAFALAGFSNDATHVASSGTPLALNGVTNAFANAGNLVSVGSGQANATTPAGNGTVPQQTINTLANILAACVNSADNLNGDGSFNSYSSNCSTLFSNTTFNGVANVGSQPTNTATAAINIAHFPGSNTSALYGLPTGNPPFAPALVGATAPTDFILGIQYTHPSLNNPGGIAIDASGNAWITNYTGNSVTELNSLGAPVTGESSTGYTDATLKNPSGLAIDTTGNIWVANFNGGYATKFTGSGETISASGVLLGVGATSGGTAVAVDVSGNVWITSPTNNLVAKIAYPSSSVTTVSPAGLAGPTGIAADTAGNIWVSNSGTNNLIELTSGGSLVSGETSAGYTGAGLSTPFAVAIDDGGNIWATDPDNAVSALSSTGSVVGLEPTNGYTGGALNSPAGIAIDGNATIWVADQYSNKNITAFDNSGNLLVGESNTEGYLGGNLSFPEGIAVDGSGDVWVTNGVMSGTSTTVTELIGLAAPVVTPLAASLVPPYSAAAFLP